MDDSFEFEVGFYGKLPSHGDFLRRRASDAFVAVWDAWLQDCLSESRQALGSRWLDVYLISPAWRFIAAPGTCGPVAVAGVMIPSVDRVGRYFPLTIVAEVPSEPSALVATIGAEGFFEAAEQLVIEALEADVIDFEEFDGRIVALGGLLRAGRAPTGVVLDPLAGALLDGGSGGLSARLPIGSSLGLTQALLQVMSQRLTALYDPLMLWWTDGSSMIEPSCLISSGLPDPARFTALLDGAWSERQWRTVSSRRDERPNAVSELVAGPPLMFRSAALSDVGRVRSVNQDAFLERPDVGVFCVADGVGGHSDGEVASRMVCDALADFIPDSSFELAVAGAAERIERVNDHLARAAARSPDGVRSGSTVVALLVRASRLAILWAGDSRAYRLRAGELEQLTHDHGASDVGLLVGGESANAVTRAVGGDDSLELERYEDKVLAGDRFLLCSDGLTRNVSPARIEEWLAHEDLIRAVRGLVDATLDAGAPDNVTALVIEACA